MHYNLYVCKDVVIKYLYMYMFYLLSKNIIIDEILNINHSFTDPLIISSYNFCVKGT